MSQTSGPTRPLRILVADDEPMILSVITRVLERRGHEVHGAVSAPEAISLMGAHSFDAALVDAGMPGDGLTVLHELSQDPGFEGQIVLMTGGLAADPSIKVDPDVKRLQKPFKFPDVIPLLEDSLRH